MRVKLKNDKKIFKISVKVSLLFAIITLVIMGLLVLTSFFILRNSFQNINEAQLELYFANVSDEYQNNRPISSDKKYNSLMFGKIEKKNFAFNNKLTHYPHSDTLPVAAIEQHLLTSIHNFIEQSENTQQFIKHNNVIKHKFHLRVGSNYYYVRMEIRKIYGPEPKLYNLLLAYNGSDFVRNIQGKAMTSVLLTTITASLLIFIIAFIWTQYSITKRIKDLSREASQLLNTNFKQAVSVRKNDEITELAKAINKLRLEILSKEVEKQEMLQNISHDIKNPVAIIQSYAEAIEDGISDISDIKIIKSKANEIAKRINQLLKYIKYYYTNQGQSKRQEYIIKPLLMELVKENKFRFQGSFNVSGDDSVYLIDKEQFLIAIQNIIDNAIRYANKVIKLEIKNKILTIYNDGKEINEQFIREIFTPYKMGIDGQFGLGMGITKAILNSYQLAISVKNEQGVIFTIAPL